MEWIAYLLTKKIQVKLLIRTPQTECIFEEIFKEVIKLKWGQ